MLFKMKLGLCMLALTTAAFARAQENAAKTGAPSQSQVGKAQSQNDNQTPSDQNKNRRQENSAKSSDTQNRDSTSEDRNANKGQDRNRNPREVTTRTETRETRYGAANDSPIDAQLASCLLIGNQKEVTISQFASERAKHEKVKEFAKQMVKDHTQAISMLQRFAGPDAGKDLSSSESTRTRRTETKRSTTTADSNEKNRDSNNRDSAKSADAIPRTDSDSPLTTNPADRNANDRPATSVQVRTEHDAMPDKMLAIQREVAQKCIAMAKHELEQSNNFDQAYVGMQIAEHMGMIAHLETYKSYASADLGKVIQESLDTAQGHLRHAKELVMEISHDSASGNRSNANSNSDASNRSETNRRDATPRSSTNRDDATPRREGVKKDAPKS